MKKIVRLTERDLARLVKRIINEHDVEDGEENVRYESESDMRMYANDFRKYVNQFFPKLAKSLNLSLQGPKDNDIIKKAWRYQLNMEDFKSTVFSSPNDVMKMVYKTLGEIYMNEVIRDI